MITDYTTLKAAVLEYLARDQDATLTARVPTFIQLFEAKMNRTLFFRMMEQRSTSVVDPLSDEPEFVSLPSDFQTMRRITLSGVAGKPRLEFMTQTQLDDFRTQTGSVVGQPVYYTIFGNEIELAPTPGEAYALSMIYRKNIPALSDSNTTNWLLTLAPDLYLYGALLESAPYMKEDARIQTWGAGLSVALSDLNAIGAQVSFDSGPTTVSLPGVCP